MSCFCPLPVRMGELCAAACGRNLSSVLGGYAVEVSDAGAVPRCRLLLQCTTAQACAGCSQGTSLGCPLVYMTNLETLNRNLCAQAVIAPRRLLPGLAAVIVMYRLDPVWWPFVYRYSSPFLAQ